ncbi:MAG: type II toxin-antitoxin system PemK/MazF family toxin [Rickettsiales bacterium]
MQKDFDGWIVQKKKAHHAHERPMFKEREVWWCGLGANVGDEQDGKGQSFSRPVLVLKKFNRNIFIGIPLSTQLKDKPYYYKFHFKGIEQSLILSQIRLMDAKRFRDKMGDVPSHEMEKIKERLLTSA